MRLRFRKLDLQELARLYRGAAATERRRAEEMRAHSNEWRLIEAAKLLDDRAVTLEEFARLADDFVMMPTKPFDGGPPSLMVVGGSHATDGSAFVTKRKGR